MNEIIKNQLLFRVAVVISYPLAMQNFTLDGRPRTMDDGSSAMGYQYNATLPNGALIRVSPLLFIYFLFCLFLLFIKYN